MSICLFVDGGKVVVDGSGSFVLTQLNTAESEPLIVGQGVIELLPDMIVTSWSAYGFSRHFRARWDASWAALRFIWMAT